MLLVHHHCLISWLWQKWIGKSHCLLKGKISKWKPSTEIIADKSRSLSASVSHTGSCVSCRMHWSHASSYKRLLQSSLSLHAAAFSKATSSFSSELVQERMLSCGRGGVTVGNTFRVFLAPPTLLSLQLLTNPKEQLYKRNFPQMADVFQTFSGRWVWRRNASISLSLFLCLQKVFCSLSRCRCKQWGC